MQPKFFPTPADWRTWLERNHESETELWVGFYKKGTGKPSITWPESVDQALCFGWIDGKPATLPPAMRKVFMANKRAWKFFQSQPAGYRAIVTNWLITAKQEATRDRRLATLIKDSAEGKRIAQLRPPERKNP